MARNSTIENSFTNNEKKTKMSTSSKDATASFCTNIKQNICQNLLLIWLDANIDESNQDVCNSLTHLSRIFISIQKYTDNDECIKFLDQAKNKKIFMIVSGSLGQKILPKIHEKSQLKSVFVFCSNRSVHENLQQKYKKVNGIFTDILPISKRLCSVALEYDRNSIAISIFPTKLQSNQRLSELDDMFQKFLFIQLVKENILRIDSGQNAIKDFVKYCREQHIEGFEIEKFEKEYNRNTIMERYDSEPFLFLMVNLALNGFEVDAIINMGFFMRDLHLYIEEVYKTPHDNNKECFNVYRSQGLSEDDFKKLQENVGHLMSFDNFFIADKYENDCDEVARETIKDAGMIGIVFCISIDLKKSTKVFAAIPLSEQKFMFSFHTVFQITKIKPTSKRIFEVKLALISDDDNNLDAVNKLIRDETWGLTGWDRLSELLFKFGKVDKAKEIYNVLLKQESSHSERALLYQQRGRIERQQGDNDSAVKSYEKACEILKKTTNQEVDLADCYNNIGLVYENMGEYAKALSSHKEALGIRKKLSPEHPKLASSYNNLGNVCNAMGEYSDARSYHKSALAIREKVLPNNHPHLANSYSNLGLVFFNEQEYLKALKHHERALKIRINANPPNNLALASSYNNIGLVNEKMGDISEACSMYQEAIKNAERSLPPDHPDLQMYTENYKRVEKL